MGVAVDRRVVRMWARLLCGIVLIAIASPITAWAQESTDDGEARMIRVEDAWSRATPPGVDVGAGYFALINAGQAMDRLVGAESPVAQRVQVHRTVEEDDTTSMEHQADGVIIPPGSRIEFAPGGYHLMLMQLEEPLEEGDEFPVTLRFKGAGAFQVDFTVRSLTAGE